MSVDDGERERLIASLESLAPEVSEVMRGAGADVPDWEPLEKVLPLEECAGFMFMGYWSNIRLYKNGFTRHYLNVDPQGHCYGYDSLDRLYRPIPTETAIEHAFDGIEASGWKRTSRYNRANARKRRKVLEDAGWKIVTLGSEGA